jgi:uncharacterized membrane protein
MTFVWYGILYSFVGFLLEVVFARLTGAEKRDRKCFLFLPLCPVYGLGAVAILLLPESIQRAPLLLLPCAGVVATAVEYGVGTFYEKVWGVAFWNYSALRGNVQGRVCLPFSLCWGVLGLGLVYGVQPLVVDWVAGLPNWLLFPLLGAIAVDFVISGHLLRQSHSTKALIWYRPPEG